jgi:hypothetical protein
MLISSSGNREDKNVYEDESGGGCGVFCSFYCSVSPEIPTKHTRSSVGL